MKRFASVRFDGVLAGDERDAAAHFLASVGAKVTSWNAAAGRTYASLTLDADTPEVGVLLASLPPGAAADEPARIVLRVTPDAPRHLPALERAFAGGGRPAGVIEARRDGTAVVVEFDARRTSLAFVVAVVDAEVGSSAARTIEPLVALDDASLAACASALLGEPALDAGRLIEPHLAALASGGER